MSKSFWNRLILLLLALFTLSLVLDIASRLVAEILWFEEVKYLSVFTKRLITQLLLLFAGIVPSAAFLLGNLFLAQRFQYQSPQNSTSKVPFISVSTIRLPTLLTIAIILSGIIALMVIHDLQIADQFWQLDLSLAKITPPLPAPFDWKAGQQILIQIVAQPWKIGVFLTVMVILLIRPEFCLRALAILMSLFFGLVLAGNWERFLQYLNQTEFGQIEPLFNKDISFYVFNLPIWEISNFWLGGLFWYSLISVTLVYLLSGNSLSEGKFPGFSLPQLRHIYFLGVVVMLITALRHLLTRYELLYSIQGVSYGASYTEVKTQLPAEMVLSVVALTIALWFLFRAIFGRWYSYKSKQLSPSKLPLRTHLRYLLLLLFGNYFVIAAIGTILIPAIVQTLQVQPNELELETPYIKRSIALTRAAFALDTIEVKTFDPDAQLSAAKIEDNNLTIKNIRLWDQRPLLQTNRQLQQIRLYYGFSDADIDRYNLKLETSGVSDALPNSSLLPSNADDPLPGEKQQVIIAPRELDYEEVPSQAKTWVNKHLVYTHGYGFTISPVNRVAEGGLPYYYVRDIGTADEAGALLTSSTIIADSIPITNPRIYYGEYTKNYIMTSTKAQELDFPSGEENVYNTYDGTGGIDIGNYGRRFLFAEYLKDWQMLFTNNFQSDTKLLFRRPIKRRAQIIAPFLRYDGDPYLVTANASLPSQANSSSQNNHLYWILDAYTTSDRYPYSDPGDNTFNYIRNSVKVVIDAYNGNVDFFVADAKDPMIQTWTKIFPKLFHPLEAMPAALRSHVRYPADLFSTQSERLLTYHMTDPQVFYNREDQWQTPQEIYGNESRPVEPYYMITKLPTEQAEEFILLSPFTPTSRNNLIAWMAGRADGDNYGKLLLYQFPKQKLVYGTEQIEALINQDPVISQQISLWNRQGSRAVQGNLLVIPIEQSLLYVEPLYLEAEENSLPTLVRVIVVYDNRVVMAETLEKSLTAIFEPEKLEQTTIIRSVELENITN